MIYPTIEQLTKGEFNRYELVVGVAKCARIVTDEYVAFCASLRYQRIRRIFTYYRRSRMEQGKELRLYDVWLKRIAHKGLQKAF